MLAGAGLCTYLGDKVFRGSFPSPGFHRVATIDCDARFFFHERFFGLQKLLKGNLLFGQLD